jgi:hypothetical protein
MVKMIKYCAISLDNLNLKLSLETVALLKSLACLGLFTEISDNDYRTNEIEEKLCNFDHFTDNARNFFYKGVPSPSSNSTAPLPKREDKSKFKSNSNSESNRISSVLNSALGNFRSRVSSVVQTDDKVFLIHLVTILIQRYEKELRLIESIERSEDLNPVRYDLQGLKVAVKVNLKSKGKIEDYKNQFEEDVWQLAQDWFGWIQKQLPYRVKKLSAENFAEGIARIMKHTNLNIVGMREVFNFIRKDDFYKTLHLQPGGLLTTSKNGLTKIENILLKLKSKMSNDNPWEVIDSGEWENPFI